MSVQVGKVAAVISHGGSKVTRTINVSACCAAEPWYRRRSVFGGKGSMS